MNDETHQLVGRIDGKVDLLIDMFKTANENQGKLAERVGAVENKQAHQTENLE